MIPNKKIFCNTPWFELHVYWNGDYGICCQESRKLYKTDKSKKDHPYNIKNMSISDWYNSQPVRDLRLKMWEDQKIDICSKCTMQEKHINTSRRHKSNQKSVIFTKNLFDESFAQSPHRTNFIYSLENNGKTQTIPLDLHIDLGNYCNLACKMCHAQASSTLASQLIKWGDESAREFLGTDWTQDKDTWNKFINDVKKLPLVNLHFMGGETLITKRFHQFLDEMIQENKTDFGISFVTNGTKLDLEIIEKLKNFKRVGIEVSIESCTEANTYIRQGTNTAQVLDNISLYQQHCNNSDITLTIRPALSALSISSYYTLLEYCLQNKFILKSNMVTRPEFLQVNVLPKSIRQTYKKNYVDLIEKFSLNENVDINYNESDPHEYKKIILSEIHYVLSLLDSNDHKNAKILAKTFVEHCKKWDQVYKYNAVTIYPELHEWLTDHGY